ncbi:MAG: endoplasmic reticulum vesicle transporter-domain-containing protein [Benniella sp.]|nr:MAG: endoplasmic reticulum vesicle transporter-domain-containing protein [Benniella sp.]
MQLKEFDAFPKVEADFVRRTGSGGVLTLIVAAILCILVVGEIGEYMTLRNDYKFLVDPLINHELQINVDITIATPCDAVTIDLRDIADVQMRLSDKLHKIPTHFTLDSLAQSGNNRKKSLNVQRLIRAAKKAVALQEAAKQGNTEREACRIYGSFEANKLSGNLHITTLGHGYYGHHTDHKVMNMTHKIDEFSFGELYPTIVNPLDGSFEISEAAFEAFQYFLVVVPTIYVDRSKNKLMTNQYSVSEYRKTFEEDMGVPGLFFKYDFEPMTLMIMEESSMSFGHLLVRLAGLVGGYFVTAGMAHKVLSAIYSGFKPEQVSKRRQKV